ncbi:MAG: TonB-dependent receptor plug domain-containing protein [Myxococcota bacterium]
MEENRQHRGLRRVVLLLLLASGAPARASQPSDLTALSIEDLLEMEITSVSRKSEPISNAPSAIYVVTDEDIRRAGVRSIPEALRMVPGLAVAATDASKYAIGARGFNFRFASKQLVLIDGRSVYTPIFSGVYWDVQDTDLDSIERIEVIRGPGGTMWGSNAVNGVINIITKDAEQSQGVYLSGGWGTQERGFGTVRWGGRIGQGARYRVFGKYFNRNAFVDTTNDDAKDDWAMGRGGFRLDWEVSEIDAITLHGEWYRGEAHQRVTLANYPPPPASQSVVDSADLSGGYLLGRWRHEFSDSSDLVVQYYYDRAKRREDFLEQTVDTYDLDLQHRFSPWQRHDMVWGVSYRLIVDGTRPTFVGSLTPREKDYDLLSGFVQDGIELVPGRLGVTAGIKIEHNGYTHFEYQPSVRMLWTPHPNHRFWAAVSRAVRTPSRSDLDIRFVKQVIDLASPSLDILGGFVGNQDVKSEDLLAYELGYRVHPARTLSLDLATFYNIYDDLGTAETLATTLDTSVSPPALAAFAQIDRKASARSYGVELAGNWEVTPRWKLRGSYSFFQLDLDVDNSSNSTSTEKSESDSPSHQFNLRSFYNLTDEIELDTMLYVVGNLHNQDTHSYTRLDVRLGWRPRPELELSLALQNLLEHRHKEFGDGEDGVLSSEVPRSIYARATWRY